MLDIFFNPATLWQSLRILTKLKNAAMLLGSNTVDETEGLSRNDRQCLLLFVCYQHKRPQPLQIISLLPAILKCAFCECFKNYAEKNCFCGNRKMAQYALKYHF